MSAEWYFVSSTFFGGRKTVGPISETDLIHNIEKGKIKPETMLSSPTKTHGNWVKMKEIRVAKKLWDKTHPAPASK